MAIWLNFNMSAGAINGKQLVSRQNMDFIHSPQTVIARLKNGDLEQAYGEGWFIDKQTYKPYTLLYHAGGGTGMHGQMAYIPELKIGIVVLTNQYTNKAPEILSRQLFDLYLDSKSLRDWNKIYLQQRIEVQRDIKAKEMPPTCQNPPMVDLEKYTGTYFNPVFKGMVVSKVDDHLSLEIGPQHIAWQLTPCGNNVFKAYWPNPSGMKFPMLPTGQDRVEFTQDRQHSIVKMLIPFLGDGNFGIFEKE